MDLLTSAYRLRRYYFLTFQPFRGAELGRTRFLLQTSLAAPNQHLYFFLFLDTVRANCPDGVCGQ
jgi:hypothetical protein